MTLTGKAKTDYQREYMRKRRSNAKPELVRPEAVTVRPEQLDPVRPDVTPKVGGKTWQETKDKIIIDTFKEPESQSHSPMMVGYVPPQE